MAVTQSTQSTGVIVELVEDLGNNNSITFDLIIIYLSTNLLVQKPITK
jgi:hypothetical protein